MARLRVFLGGLVALSLAGVPAAKGADPDHDGDGIKDLEDDCPTDPGIAKNRGCPGEPPAPPAAPLAKRTGDRVEISRHIEFESGSDKLLGSAQAILKAVADVIATLPEDRGVIIRGHTDDRGKPTKNLDLSKRRAKSVQSALIGLGINSGRLRFEGHGETKPIADNDNEEGRAKNRRVEFVIAALKAAP